MSTRPRARGCGESRRAVARWMRSRGENLSHSGVGGFEVSSRFEGILRVRKRLAECVSLADSRWGMMMIAGFRGLYIQKKVRATSGLLAKEGEVSRLKSVVRRMRKTALQVKAAWKSARGSCKLTPALHHQSSNQEEARVFENRGEERERETMSNKRLRCPCAVTMRDVASRPKE